MTGYLRRDEGGGETEVKREEEREDCHGRVHLQHQTGAVPSQTGLLQTGGFTVH